MTNFDETRERAILVGIDRPGSPWPVDSSLEELARLVDTAGADVVATTTQRLNAPNPRTFVGSGKAEEIAELCRAHAADLVFRGNIGSLDWIALISSSHHFSPLPKIAN